MTTKKRAKTAKDSRRKKPHFDLGAKSGTCPACGKPVEGDWKVCPACGASIDPGAIRQG